MTPHPFASTERPGKEKAWKNTVYFCHTRLQMVNLHYDSFATGSWLHEQ
ncbi:hypothetical protein SAMN03080610_03482 [Afifella marina DSM 2698]|uniref:Uncharacterized protein n=1 Tax=Afifella marina DSM 2698 TaxID=1120955 RepID=A0A1G5P8W8_AFIMA|nr:hypothetical protein SAMN03080610_03482 [Afifella marina DSM 2698]